MANDPETNGAQGDGKANGKAELDELIRSKEEELRRLHDERRRWEEGPLAKALEKSGERREHFETLSGLETDRIYTPEHVEDLDYERDLGFPGQYPFTRGTAGVPGPSASTPASARRRPPTSASSSSSRRASQASPRHSTFPRRWVSTRTTSVPPAK
jgi:hypothetical protein